MEKLCYWCKHDPCTCRTLADDYPKSMIKPAFQPKVCKFCKQEKCICPPIPFAKKVEEKKQ